ncbi:MAG: hypothetical protein ABSD20_08935 [Terriglobales bacterium]|jgi:hypothetical protein
MTRVIGSRLKLLIALSLQLHLTAWCTQYLAQSGTAAARPKDHRPASLSEYQDRTNSQTDRMIGEYSRLPRTRLVFSANEVGAYGAVIKRVPDEVLLAWADALKEAGVQRIDMNPAISSIFDPVAARKYEALIRHIGQIGLKIAINPEYEAGADGMFTAFKDFQNAALKAYAEWASRFHPDHFVLIHEPTTMANRMGLETTTFQWRAFVEATAKVVKQASPATRVGAGVFAGMGDHDVPFFEEFSRVPDLEFLTIDNYVDTPYAISRMDALTKVAHDAHKPVYMEETWRPHFILPGTGKKKGASEESVSAIGFGYSGFEPLDVKWLNAMTLYAATHGMEAVTPFQTRCFFAYVESAPYDGPEFNHVVERAILQKKRTETFRAFQQYIREYGQ